MYTCVKMEGGNESLKLVSWRQEGVWWACSGGIGGVHGGCLVIEGCWKWGGENFLGYWALDIRTCGGEF